MEFTNHNDLELILKLENHGRPIRVSDCVRFAVRVFTQNPNNFLLFTEREINRTDRHDILVIPDYQMKALESGVIIYEYCYSLDDRHFVPFEGHHHHDHTKRVTTDQYWKNCNYNQIPANPINYKSLNYLRELIEKEVADRENAIIDLRDYFDSGFIGQLTAEIERATAKENELEAKINENKEIADGCVDALLEKIDAEIKRSNEVDIQLFNAIKQAGDNSTADKEETDNKITDTNTALADEVERAKAAEKELSDTITAEADRAKAAERQLTNDLTDEVSRAKVKENELDAKIDGEIARAKVIENALTDSVDAVRDRNTQIANDLAAEVSRSNQKDNEHTAALNSEVTRAQASEKAITDRLDVIEGDKTVVGSIAHSLEDAKHYADDVVSQVNSSNATAISSLNDKIEAEVSRAETAEKALGDRLDVAETNLNTAADAIVNLNTAINNEVSRATAKEAEIDTKVSTNTTKIADLTDRTTAVEGEVNTLGNDIANINDALAVVNGDKDTIGSISHAVEDAKHYTDDVVAGLKTETSTNLADALKPYATKQEVDGRIEGIIGTAPSALDTLGEIADKLGEDSDAIKALNGVLVDKANKSDVYSKTEADAKHTALSNELATANTAITNEVSRATAAETAITSKVDALGTKVDSVKAVSDKAAADLADEITRAKAAEADLSNELSTLDTKVDGVKATAEKNATDIADLSTAINGAKADINGVVNDLASEVSRATAKESELESGVSANASKIADITKDVSTANAGVTANAKAIADEATRAKGAEADITTALNSEISRAQTKEGEIDAAIAIINGNSETIGSIAHCLDDSKHYTDDEISKLNAKVDASVTGFATKSEVAAVDAKVENLKSKVDNLDLDIDAYTKAEVDQMIEDIDVTDQLTDYAKTSETTVIKDENGNIITEMVIDNSEADDTIEVYTKQQCDELFAKVVTLTQAEYDALTTKAPNTLYIVNG